MQNASSQLFNHFAFYYLARRIRAASAKSTLKINASKLNGYDKNAVVDPHFASPKRKDFKLDTESLQQIVNDRGPSNGVTTNGRRTNKSANGSRSKKPNSPITNYFAVVDEQNVAANQTNLSNTSNDLEQSRKPQNSLPDEEKYQEKNAQQNGNDQNLVTNGISNGVLMSPEFKALPNNLKQTTPHRIVCHSSPLKSQRPYAKDPAQVFSNLNIRDNASPKPKGNRKREPRLRRKLNVEYNENGETDGFVVPKVPVAGETKTEKPTTNNNFVANGTSAKQVRDTLMNEYFPIRRSVRKTQKVIEEEQTRYIEKAIEEQRQDGLVIREFDDKGRGIVAARPFQRGEYVVEYIGELIDQMEADKREARYMKNANFGCYMYYFRHKEQQWW